ncbi:MAG: BTAD domain-containing putative transcriptional regulator [Gaiellaceae bacterium]
MMEFRVLGLLEGPVGLPGGKPRALLARLLLDAGRVVSAEALVDSLWEEPVPPSAPKVLQAHVSTLRKALGAGAIETRSPGYVLHGTPVDLSRFEELSGRARDERDAQRRAALLRDALALWRGDPFAEFSREPFARTARARLAELRLDALIRRIDAELELGEHERLVPELGALVDAEPLREQPRRQLMLALYRSGRQADALATYRAGRRLLVEELGIEPGVSLQDLERAILRQDAALSLEARPAARGPIVCVGTALVNVLAPLDRELLVVAVGDSLTGAASSLPRVEGARVRTAAFTSSDVAADAVRLATEQAAELLVVASVTDALLASSPCDVALVNGVDVLGDGAVLVPFGGGRDEWPALELGAWLARAHGKPLRLLGVEATGERRDASRLLAGASLALQRFGGVTAETALVAPGADGVLEQRGAAIVASLPRAELDRTRTELRAHADVPVLLVHGGLRPSGLAPDRTLTRFSWSLGGRD